MNYDKLAFFNQQLAGMLKSSIPLESALKQLCSEMEKGPFKEEIEKLHEDLSKGLSFKEALKKRKLPPFYAQMLEVGIKSNDLPGMLTLLAEYYQKTGLIWTRLKGVMFYPAIILFFSLLLSAFYYFYLSKNFSSFIEQMLMGAELPTGASLMASFPPIVLALLFTWLLFALFLPRYRKTLRWKLPAFKEASLSQFASSVSMLMKGGSTLPESLALLQELEKNSPISREIEIWQSRLSKGHPKLSEIVTSSKIIPPLFAWIIGNSGEDAGKSFQKAADIYQGRANYRIELFLYAALPVSILFLGVLITSQMYSNFLVFIKMITTLGDVG